MPSLSPGSVSTPFIVECPAWSSGLCARTKHTILAFNACYDSLITPHNIATEGPGLDVPNGIRKSQLLQYYRSRFGFGSSRPQSEHRNNVYVIRDQLWQRLPMPVVPMTQTKFGFDFSVQYQARAHTRDDPKQTLQVLDAPHLGLPSLHTARCNHRPPPSLTKGESFKVLSQDYCICIPQPVFKKCLGSRSISLNWDPGSGDPWRYYSQHT